MPFNELTAEQKAVLSDYARMTRAWCGEQARVSNHGDAISTAYTAQVQAILALLGTDDPITDGSGLAGAVTLTKADVGYITGYIQTLLSTHNTAARRQMYVKAAGPTNLIG